MAMETAHRCDRAHAWASLRVDGELSQLESALLDAHLRGCATCRAFAAEVEASTRALRAMPPAQLPQPVLVPAVRRTARRGAGGLVAAAAVVAASLTGALIALDQLNGPGGAPRPTAMISSTQESNVFRSLRREQLIAQSRPLPRNKAFF